MPTVPSYGDPSVMPTIGPQERLAPVSSGAGELAGEQLQRAGAAVSGAGNAMGSIAVQMQDQANDVRLAAARNQALEAQQKLMYGDGPNDPTALLNQKGAQALQRDSGQALPDEYADKYQQALSDISGQLGNAAQRRQFQVESQQLMSSFRGAAEQHMLSEFRDYQGSTWDGQVSLAHNQAIKAWNSPDAIDQSLALVKQGVYQKARLAGLSGNQAQAEIDNAVSGVHRGVIESALENNNPAYALQYFNTHRPDMSATDTLAVLGQVNHQMDGRMAMQSVGAATSHFGTQFAPTELDRLTGIVRGIESGGKDTNADGTPVVSSRGAKYAMQVMPATAQNPGFNIEPAKDDSAAEYNRVGQQYLAALVQKYGDVGKALAAYNAGPEAVDTAVARGGNWLAILPKETQDYVQKGVSQFQAGQGAPTLPTKTEFVQYALSQLGDNPRPEQVGTTREAAEKQYQLLVDSRKEQGEQALAAAHKALIANGGDFAALDPQIKSDLARFDSEQYAAAELYAKKISRGENNTDLGAYNAAVTYPEELAKMTDTQFEQFLKTNFSTADAERVSRLRASYLTGKADQSAGSLNSPAFNTIVGNRLNSIGINPQPDRKDNDAQQRVGAIKKFIADDIYAQQTQLGRKLTPEEISQHVDQLFAKSENLKKTLFGMQYGTNTMPLLGMRVGDIPAADMNGIRASFAKAGIAKPTDDQIMRAYWTKKNGR